MKKFKGTKKLIALLLSLSLITGMMPAMAWEAFAETEAQANEATYVIAGSDFQLSGNNNATLKTQVGSILKKIQGAGYSNPAQLLFAGDYSVNGATDTTAAKNGIKALKEAVNSVYDGLGDNMILVQGNHDPNHSSVSDIAASGNHDTGEYGVYVINEDDFPWGDGATDSTEADIRKTASALSSYLNEKKNQDYIKPIFIVSHLPLHYTYRTPQRGDGVYAEYIFDVINKAAKDGLNIIFMFGHNHSSPYDSYLGGGSIFLRSSDKIWIADPGDRYGEPNEKDLYFTYMTAGYVGYSGDAADDELTMSVFEIKDNEVVINRYSASGIHNLKNAGVRSTVANDIKYSPAVNTKVYTSPQTIKLNQQIVDPVDVEIVSKPSTLKVGENGTAEATSSNTTATFSWSSSNSKVATVIGNGETATIKGVGVGTATITVTATPATRATDVAGTAFFNVTVTSTDAVVIPGTESKIVWRPATSLDVGKTYLLVSDIHGNDGNNRYAVANTSSATIATKGVTVKSDNQGEYIETDDETLMWVAEESPKVGNYSHPYLTNVSTSRSLQYRSGSELRTTSTPSNNDNDYTKWRIGGSYDGLYVIAADDSASQYRRYMYYNASNAKLAMSSSATDTREITAWVQSETQSGSGDISVSMSSLSGTVKQKAGPTASTGATLIVQDEDGNTHKVNITLGMLKDANGNAVSTETVGTQSGLSVYYMDNLISDDFTLRVVERVDNDYPEYPDPGSVNVGKTADSTYLQQTGVTKVELSTSGIPVDKGVDVLVVVDTSSSMSGNRISALQDSLKDMILAFNQKNGQGDIADVQIAIMDFNGYYNTAQGLSYKKGTELTDIGNYWDREDAAKVYTGTYKNQGTATAWANGADAFVQNTEFVNANGTLNTNTFDPSKVTVSSGTAYDLGLQRAYNLLADKQEQNKNNGEERDSFVIFMSDGAPYGYNGIVTKTDYEVWNDYLLGTYPTLQALEDAVKKSISENGGNSASFEMAALDNGYGYLYNGQGKGDGVKTDASGAALHPHRWAEAIKGDPQQEYDVSDVATYNLSTKAGLGATMYTIGFQLANDKSGSGDYNKKTGRGGYTYKATMEAVLKVIASYDYSQTNTRHYYAAEDAQTLSQAFTKIASSITYAATDAYFLDQMGKKFNLQMASTVNKRNESGNVVATALSTLPGGINPQIQMLSYDIYKKSDVGSVINGVTVTEEMVGERYGEPTVIETVTFTDDGKGNITGAYSDALGASTNILNGKVIEAKNFWYNTSTTAAQTITLTNGSTYSLPSETFYWNIGTINEKEYALSYYVYLEGSMEGSTEAGSYNTNEYATLHYNNWLRNEAKKDTVSPSVGWLSANVSYAFYLVDEFGNPIVNQTTGEIGSFYNAVKVTRPVQFQEIMLNNLDSINTIEAASQNVLPKEYELFDSTASYKVVILSEDGKGSWTITSDTTKKQSTYVTGHYGTNASNQKTVTSNQGLAGMEDYELEEDYDYTHTTVWFAVVWTPKALPDTVVVDYGLPVEISVLSNDMFGEAGKLVGVGAYSDGTGEQAATNLNGHDTTLALGFGEEYTSTYGTAKADTTTGKVRYTPASMEMNGYDKFAYAVNYNGNENSGYYYNTVTVIPATTIYYEEDFITYNDITWQQKEGGPAWEGEWAVKEVTNPEDSVWRTEGEKKANAVQGEDRPGQYSLADANHIYGYDAVNKGMSTYSLGSAKVATVSGNDGAQAQFTFYGTGFDIISMTNNTTGAILVDVEKKVGNEWTTFDNYVVDTYYGYKQVAGDADKDGTIEEGEVIWEVDPKAEDSLYQVPVIKMVNKEYGQYRVTIKATYEQFFDHVDGSSAYDFYLDAIRIYDPANDGASDGTTDTTIEDAYKADGEGWPSYIELRNKLIDTEKKFGGIWGSDDPTTEDEDERTVVEGLVFIDGDDSVGDNQITDYKNYGPNNEVYLKPGQRVAFMVNAPSNLANIHIGIKSADGIPATYTITNIAREDSADGKVKAGDYYNAKTTTIDTATDMYYDMTPWKGNIVVISNTGDRYGTTGAISLTNIKSTYTSDPNGQETTGEAKAGNVEPKETSIYMTPAAATLTLRSLNTPVTPEEPETPDTPVTPEDPDTPVTPEDPETPVVPENPVEPEEPETPPVVEEPEEPVVAPAKIISLKTDKQNYVQGDKVKVTVTTNKEATKVKVGTKVLKNYTTKNGNRTWTTTVNATKLGKLTIGAIAYNSKGTATNKVTKVVTVKKFAPRIFNVTLNKYKVKKGQKYTVTVKAGSSVKHVRVNGKKITKFTTKNGVKTFKVTFKANKVGKQKVKVIAYNKALYSSNPKGKTITVTRK